MTNEETTWDCKLDAFRPINDYSDLIRIVACYYEMYSKAVEFVGPWIAKQRGGTFLPPDRDQVKTFLGKERPPMSFRAKSCFIDSLIVFLRNNKGKKTLITPSPSSHHSAQFPRGTFEITLANEPIFNASRRISINSKVYRIEFEGADTPIYVENLKFNPNDIKFLILRPKLGKLGMPNILRWEILFYKKDHGYIIDHTDSHLNPKWSGIF
jgi:hypothetical protein